MDIFDLPVIYVLIQNSLLYVHVSSAVQNAPASQPVQTNQYGYGMNTPLARARALGSGSNKRTH